VETLPQSGGYILGFRIDPPEALQETAREIHNIYTVFSKDPIFGPNITVDEKVGLIFFFFFHCRFGYLTWISISFLPSNAQPTPLSQLKLKKASEDVEIVDSAEGMDALSIYYADVAKTADHEPTFAPEIHLAVEKLPEGVTIENLWRISSN
jgi:Bardet-Biedl syndrome 5 protein